MRSIGRLLWITFHQVVNLLTIDHLFPCLNSRLLVLIYFVIFIHFDMLRIDILVKVFLGTIQGIVEALPLLCIRFLLECLALDGIMKALHRVLLIIICGWMMNINIGIVIVDNNNSTICRVHLHIGYFVAGLSSIVSRLHILLRLDYNLVTDVPTVIDAVGHRIVNACFHLLLIHVYHAACGSLLVVLSSCSLA